MTWWSLILRNARYHANSHLGTFLGAAIGTAVLAGALIVGDSVRGSLKKMALERLGKVDAAITSGDRLFRSALAGDLEKSASIQTAAGLQLIGASVNPDNALRANKVQVVGVGSDFWKFAPVPINASLSNNTVWINSELALQLQAKTGDTILLRIPKASQLSREAPLSPSEDSTAALRLEVGRVLSSEEFGHFGLQANQIAPFNAFVPLEVLGRRVGATNQANLLLAEKQGQNLAAAVSHVMTLADAQLELRVPPGQSGAELRSSRIFLDDVAAKAARSAAPDSQPIFTYFVNELRLKDHATPYSMVTAAEPPLTPVDLKDDEIVINQWLADDLLAKPGDAVSLAYFVVGLGRELVERTNVFKVHSIVPMSHPSMDRTLMPDFPGMTTADNCRDWDTGFPIKTDRIRDKDEAYWHQFRGTPKAFLTLAAGQKMWSNRFGSLTSVRYPPADSPRQLASKILEQLPPDSVGLQFRAVRQQALDASSQSEDFGGLFIGFSFFLVIAALILMSLLFKFGIEQRGVEIGTLLALGFTPRQVRRSLLIEGGIIAFLASLLGLLGGVAYAHGMLFALSTIWRKAIASAALTYFASPQTLAISAFAGTLIAFLTIWWSLRKEARRPARELLAEGIAERSFAGDQIDRGKHGFSRFVRAEWIALIFGLGGIAMALWGIQQKENATADLFFSAGTSVLIAGLAAASWVIRRLAHSEAAAKLSIFSLGVRGISRRASRSRATIGLLACGSFLIASIGAFHLDTGESSVKRSSGTGGFALIGESSLPILQNPNSKAMREEAGLPRAGLDDVNFVSFRVREGEEASCLNLNRAQQPRLLGVDPQALASRGAFGFSETIDSKVKDAWSLLDRDLGPGVVGAIGDAASIEWALKKKMGDDIVFLDEQGKKVRVRIVAAVANSILQGSLIISERNFVKLFPSEAGYRFFLIDAPAAQAGQATSLLSKAFQDNGMEITAATARLAAFNAVQNTYLNTFQVLGGLGLLLGTAGLGVVLLRNVFERRGELALLLAVGFEKKTLRWLIVSEHAILLLVGLLIGVVTAAIAVLPALLGRGAVLPYGLLGILLFGVFTCGITVTLLAAARALHGNLLQNLRIE